MIVNKPLFVVDNVSLFGSYTIHCSLLFQGNDRDWTCHRSLLE